MPAWNVVCSIIDLNDAKETFVLTLKYWCNGKTNQDCSNEIKDSCYIWYANILTPVERYPMQCVL